MKRSVGERAALPLALLQTVLLFCRAASGKASRKDLLFRCWLLWLKSAAEHEKSRVPCFLPSKSCRPWEV